MNWDRGFKRLTFLLSIVAASFWPICAILDIPDEGGTIADLLEFEVLIIFISLSVGPFIIVWLIYYLLRWLVLGFKSEKKGCEK